MKARQGAATARPAAPVQSAWKSHGESPREADYVTIEPLSIGVEISKSDSRDRQAPSKPIEGIESYIAPRFRSTLANGRHGPIKRHSRDNERASR